MHLISDSEIHIIAGDVNGHVGEESGTFNTYHGGKDYGTRYPKWMRSLDLSSASYLAVSNTFFDKNKSKLITFSSTVSNSQIDYILVKDHS